jgi:hypothetical protein
VLIPSSGLPEGKEPIQNFISKLFNQFNVGIRPISRNGGWIKLHNEELHNLYSSPNVIKMTKSRRLRWARHVTCMGERRNAYRVFGGKARGKETTRKT